LTTSFAFDLTGILIKYLSIARVFASVFFDVLFTTFFRQKYRGASPQKYQIIKENTYKSINGI